MRILLNMKRSWSAIRWKMLVIFAFFSVISMILVACFALAILNVVIRRESAYLIEERIKVIVDGRNKLADSLVHRVSECQGPGSDSTVSTEYLDAAWPESQSLVSVLPKAANHGISSTWHDTGSFAGIVADGGSLEIRSFRSIEREGCSVTILVRNPVDTAFLEELSREASLQISSSKPVLLGPYRAGKELPVKSKPISFRDLDAPFLLLSSQGIGKLGNLRIGWYARSVRVIRGR
jgi:hypothetical protein